MPTPRENLETRRSNITAELAAMNTSSNGGRPTYNSDGQMVDHTAYRKSLYDELKAIGEQLAVLDQDENGVFSFSTQGL